MSGLPSFSKLVVAAMARRGLGLRELCRRARLDPSFLSKVLAGKRNPPNTEDVLRRLAAALETDPVELVVAAGRLPSEWTAITADSELLRRVDAMASSGREASDRAIRRGSVTEPYGEEMPLPKFVGKRPASTRRWKAAAPFFSPKPFAEELL